MQEYPSIDDALSMLAEISEAEADLLPTTQVLEADIDSLDVLEWMFQLGIEAESFLEDESSMLALSTMTLADLYALLIESSEAQTATAG